MSGRAVGLLLVVVGVAGMARRFAWLPAVPSAAWLLVLAALVALLWARPAQEIPRTHRLLGTLLLGVAALVGAGPLQGLAPPAVLAAAFLGRWARTPHRTWPLLVGGLLASVTLTGMANAVAPAWNPAPVLFLGFAATFSAVYLMPNDAGRHARWASFPAVFFAVMTVVVNDPARGLPSWLLPLLLILGGVTMLAGVRREGR